MNDLLEFIAERTGSRIRNGRLRLRCPSHQGRGETSLSLSSGRDGVVLAKCFAGCDYAAIADALEQTYDVKIRGDRKDWTDPRGARAVWTPPVAPVAPTYRPLPVAPVGTLLPRQTWLDALPAYLGFEVVGPGQLHVYELADGRPYVLFARWETRDGGKEPRPISWNRRRGDWQVGGTSDEDGPFVFPLYNRVDLAARPEAPVLLVEGEKAANAGREDGRLAAFVVTCAFGGSSPRAGTQWSALKGRSVYAAPDADPPGKKWGSSVRIALDGVASSLKVLPPQEVHKMLGGNGLTPTGWDIADGALSLCATCGQEFYPIEQLNRVCGGCTPIFA